MQESDTQWYKSVLKNPSLKIEVGGTEAEFKAIPVTDAKQVSSVVERFRDKYGASDVRKYCSRFDVAVLPQVPWWRLSTSNPLGVGARLVRKYVLTPPSFPDNEQDRIPVVGLSHLGPIRVQQHRSPNPLEDQERAVSTVEIQ